MLSRLAMCNGKRIAALTSMRLQACSTVGTEPGRITRSEQPAPVRHVFIPEEWFTFFYPKTGVTGPYVFAAGVSTYLLSKEIYILEHEFYTGLSLLAIFVLAVKKFGPSFTQFLDKQIDDYEHSWESSRITQIEDLKSMVDSEKKEQLRSDAQRMIVDIKKNNISMQLEATYRERLVQVYQEIKKRLDYHVQLHDVERKLAQKQMVAWIVENVRKAFTPEQDKIILARCIADLQNIAQKA